MAAAQTQPGPSDPTEEPPQSTQQAHRGTKRQAPCWSTAEVTTLLELWGKEEALRDPKSRRRNAHIFFHMAQALATQGHPAWTLEQVRAKVKDLRLPYVQASEPGGGGATACPHYHRLQRSLGDKGASLLLAQVDTAVATPVVRPREPEEEEGDRSMEEEVAEDSSQPSPSWPSSSQDVSLASSEAGEGLSVGPPDSEGPSCPIPLAPRIQGPSQRSQDHHHLLCCHICTIERMERALMEKVRADAEWREWVWGQYLEHCDRVCSSLGTIADRMGPEQQPNAARPSSATPCFPPALPMPPS